MACYEDLGPCPYVDYLLEAPRLLAVGWLSGAHRFPRGEVPREVATRLEGWLEALPPEPGQLVHQRGGVAIFLGSHACELQPCWKQRDDDPPPEGASDTGELFVPHLSLPGAYYVAPRLITHYLRRHRYAPPQEFVQAVLAADPARRPRFEARKGDRGLRLLPPLAG